jgi:hypothetical protein
MLKEECPSLFEDMEVTALLSRARDEKHADIICFIDESDLGYVK